VPIEVGGQLLPQVLHIAARFPRRVLQHARMLLYELHHYELLRLVARLALVPVQGTTGLVFVVAGPTESRRGMHPVHVLAQIRGGRLVGELRLADVAQCIRVVHRPEEAPNLARLPLHFARLD